MTSLTPTTLTTFLESLTLPPLPITTDYPLASPLTRPLDIARLYLATILQPLVENCTPEQAWSSILLPANIDNGDLAVVLPKLFGKNKVSKEAWGVIAFELLQKFPPSHPLLPLPFPEGVHLRLMLNPVTLTHILLPYILDRGSHYGHNALPTSSPTEDDPSQPTPPKKRIILEFSSPNLATPFASRHLRSTLLGIYLSNLYESMGYSVHKINYLGDWGKPLALLGVGFSKLPPEKQADMSQKHLSEVYAEIEELFKPEEAARKKARDEKTGEESVIESQGLFKERNEWFAKLEEGKEEEVTFWKTVRSGFVDHYEKVYEKLGVKFDEYAGESGAKAETMVEIEAVLKEKSVLEEDVATGSWVVDLKKLGHKKLGMCIIRDRSGSSTYLLRDLAAVIERDRDVEGGGFEKMVYLVHGDQHVVHFQRVINLLKLMGMEDLAGRLLHVNFGEITGVETAVEGGEEGLLEDVLEKSRLGIQAALEADPEKNALLSAYEDMDLEVMGVNALLAHELTTRRMTDYKLDIQKTTSFDGGSGLDLLYWHARLCALLKENEEMAGLSLDEQEGELESEEQTNLLRLLVQYPDVTLNAYKNNTLESAPVVAFLVNLVSQFEQCLESEEEIEVAGEDLGESIATNKKEATGSAQLFEQSGQSAESTGEVTEKSEGVIETVNGEQKSEEVVEQSEQATAPTEKVSEKSEDAVEQSAEATVLTEEVTEKSEEVTATTESGEKSEEAVEKSETPIEESKEAIQTSEEAAGPGEVVVGTTDLGEKSNEVVGKNEVATEPSEMVVETTEEVGKSDEAVEKKNFSKVELKLYEATKVVLENGMKLLGMRGIGK